MAFSSSKLSFDHLGKWESYIAIYSTCFAAKSRKDWLKMWILHNFNLEIEWLIPIHIAHQLICHKNLVTPSQSSYSLYGIISSETVVWIKWSTNQLPHDEVEK